MSTLIAKKQNKMDVKDSNMDSTFDYYRPQHLTWLDFVVWNAFLLTMIVKNGYPTYPIPLINLNQSSHFLLSTLISKLALLPCDYLIYTVVWMSRCVCVCVSVFLLNWILKFTKRHSTMIFPAIFLKINRFSIKIFVWVYIYFYFILFIHLYSFKISIIL